jgi:hypothetical protein
MMDIQQLERLATTLRRFAYYAGRATLVGNPAQVTREFNDRMRNLQVGDLVIETTTVFGFRHSPASDLDGIGWLEEVALEHVQMEWDEETDGPHPTEPVHYIRTFDGRRFRWVNASFEALPEYQLPKKP